MKQLMLLLLLVPLGLKGQTIKMPIDTFTNLITYQEIIRLDGATKKDIFNKGLEWLHKNLNSKIENIELIDTVDGEIVARGISKNNYNILMLSVNYNISYTIKLTVKENRYRYQITSMLIQVIPAPDTSPKGMTNTLEEYYNSYKSGNSSKAANTKILPRVETLAAELSGDLKRYINVLSKEYKKHNDFK